MKQTGVINLSDKEIRRLRVLHRIETVILKLKKASAMLGLCTKQMGQICKRYWSEGEYSLAQSSHGMPGNQCKKCGDPFPRHGTLSHEISRFWSDVGGGINDTK